MARIDFKTVRDQLQLELLEYGKILASEIDRNGPCLKWYWFIDEKMRVLRIAVDCIDTELQWADVACKRI
jgi:hypothetical protein